MGRRRRQRFGEPRPVRLWKCLLYALPFVAIGIFLFGRVVYDVALWQRAKSWDERPATILDASLSEGGRRRGPRAQARYQYEFDGKTYENDRVAIFPGNIASDFEETRARELEDALRAGAHVPCYVNPADPRDALLHRELRRSILAVGLVLAIVPSAIAAIVIRTYLFDRKQQQLLRELAQREGS